MKAIRTLVRSSRLLSTVPPKRFERFAFKGSPKRPPRQSNNFLAVASTAGCCLMITNYYFKLNKRNESIAKNIEFEEITQQSFFSLILPFTKKIELFADHVKVYTMDDLSTAAYYQFKPTNGFLDELELNLKKHEGLNSKIEVIRLDQEIISSSYKERIFSERNITLGTIIGLLTLSLLLNGGGRAAASSSDPSRLLRFGRANPSTAKDIISPITFRDVAGLRDAKLEISEFVDFLKNPGKYEQLGAHVPKGALLVGPPGTGKTLLARAVAGEAEVPFYSMSGSDFMEVFVGVGPSRVRDLFSQARKTAPSIVFIDEIDAIGRRRNKAGGFGSGANDERENTLNQLLVELDGFVPGTNVVVLAGTNRADVLDPALTRPGRFDRTVHIERPDLQERAEIFTKHMNPLVLEEGLNPDEMRKRLAALTPGFSGADIRNVCNEAAIYAARRNAIGVGAVDFERACERVLGGVEKTGTEYMSPRIRETVAWHEAGHAVAGWFLTHADPVVKVSIVPRVNGALGFAQHLPQEVTLLPKEQVCDRISVLLGGRVAEELAKQTATTGAQDDLDKATKLAYAYTTSWGFSPRVGLRSFPASENSFFKPFSEALAKTIDEEAGILLDTEYKRVKGLLTAKFELVKALAHKLLELETLVYKDLVEVLGRRPHPVREEYEQYIQASSII